MLETEPGDTDADKAKELLAEAGLAPGEYELEFPFKTDDQTSVRLMDLFVKSFEAAGFEATPFPTTSKAIYRIVSDPNSPLNLRQGGWCPDWASGSSWIPPLFGSDGGGASHFAEPAVDAEIERIAELPIDQQPAAWGALDKTIVTDYYPAIVTRYDAVALPTDRGSAAGTPTTGGCPRGRTSTSCGDPRHPLPMAAARLQRVRPHWKRPYPM